MSAAGGLDLDRIGRRLEDAEEGDGYRQPASERRRHPNAHDLATLLATFLLLP